MHKPMQVGPSTFLEVRSAKRQFGPGTLRMLLQRPQVQYEQLGFQRSLLIRQGGWEDS